MGYYIVKKKKKRKEVLISATALINLKNVMFGHKASKPKMKMLEMDGGGRCPMT